MSRGGYREGSGSKSTWNHGKTKTIRIPDVLAEKVLALARMLDEGKSVDDVTQSKYIDFSGVVVRNFDGKHCVLIEDLLKAGYKVRPIKLVDSVRKQLDRKVENG